ncbi:hypothetical protein M9Y10_022472 [Tritrichomonas musculus]|uniref:Uncharacterized protein n=1 Tax=Tritrichomonas musculus TaxID=1915356 RepID=A0ABR2KSE9_9EUKA
MDDWDESAYVARKINVLEQKIKQREKSIEAMRKKMQQYLSEIEIKKEQNRRLLIKKNALANQLHLYRKAIQLSSKSSKTLKQQTEELFDKENKKIMDIEDQTAELEELLDKVQKHLPSIKERLAELKIQIPDFQVDLLKINFKECMKLKMGIFNKKMILALRSTHFMEDEIQEKMNERSKLMREVKALTPPKPRMMYEEPTKSQFKKAPASEFKNSKNFESVFCDKMFNQAKSLLERYQSCLDIKPNDQLSNSDLIYSPVAVSRTPTAVARRSPRNRKGNYRSSINNYSSSGDIRSSLNSSNGSPLSSRASAKLLDSPIQGSARGTNLTASARLNRRSQRRQQYKSVNITQSPKAEISEANSNLQIRISTLTDAISKLNELLGKVNKVNESMTTFKNSMNKKIEEAKMEATFTPKSLPKVLAALEKLNETKKKIASEKAEVQSLRMDIPEQWNGSPQGLLKWQKQLLEQKEKLENSLGKQITHTENQLKDLKIVTRRRVNTLTKLKQTK